VSADLDRELQELDRRRLEVHLRLCRECSTWAERFRATTAQLREAPLEAPPATVFEFPRRSRLPRVRPVLVAAPAAALFAGVMVSLGVAHGLLGGKWTSSTPIGPTDRNFAHAGPSIDMYRLPVLHGIFRAV
jgi:predicted anti-sigma-YlaC factor YlaD